MHWGDGYGWMSAGWGFMGLFWVLIVLGIITLLAWLGGRKGSSGGQGEPPESALDILSKRYARGEIDREEFERMRRDLEK